MIICQAIGSRASIELSIAVNNETVLASDVRMSSTLNEETLTFDSTAAVLYQAQTETGIITCSCNEKGCPEKQQIQRSFYVPGK